MPCFAGRKNRRDCGLVIGEAGIEFRHDQPNNTYNIIRVIHYFANRQYVLILHKHLYISCSLSCISAVLK